MRARLMLVATLGLALACAGCTSQPANTPEPVWSASALGHGNKLVILRTAETTASLDSLEVDDLGTGDATRLWAAPPGWNARLLCASRDGIAIALSRRGPAAVGSRVTTPPASGSSDSAQPEPLAQQIVVLRSDGSALESQLPSGSIGVVSSAAFLGDTLVIAGQGPVLHNPTPAEVALMDSRGRFTFLPSETVQLDHGSRLQSLVTLPEGGVAAGIFETYGIATEPTLGLVLLRGDSLEVTGTAPRSFGPSPYETAAGSASGTLIFPIVTDTRGGARLPIGLEQANVFATEASDTVLARAVWPRWPSANGPAPAASMGSGRYVVAIDTIVHGISMPRSVVDQQASQPATSSALATVDASGTSLPTPVRLYTFAGQSDTWLWLGAFGR